MKILHGGFSNIPGFLSLGINIGIKPKSKDFGILYSDSMCEAAAVYTSNAIKGAPLIVTKQHLANHKAQAVVVNSGIANVATGEEGKANALETATLAANELGISEDAVLVASTGVIGPQLPMKTIRDGIRGIKQQLQPEGDFAEAILTTDTCAKEICVTAHGITVAGCAKGSGMIAPNMATMLAFIATDADIQGTELATVLGECVDSSFNMMSVDMDTSTSDMVIVLANEKVQVSLAQFREVLEYVCKELSKMVARDGEGATKLITAQSEAAYSLSDARKIAKVIVSSNLVKTAIYGNDPNWGRLMMAIGNSGAKRLDQDSIGIWINEELIVQHGKAAPGYNAEKLRSILSSAQDVVIRIVLDQGTFSAEAYGCDMSEDYIKINAEYTT
jgi:glutamate N-acetyltransferase / amino-acid N-acetyltransferase